MIASNETFVVAAYAITWLTLLGYLWRLARKGARAGAWHEQIVGGSGREEAR